MNTPRREAPRLHELDWLRVLAILCVFVFHSLRFFDADDWHLKNAVWHPGLTPAMMFFVLWMMPLLFTISGASVSLALRKRRPSALLKDRALRLLVPLVVGIFTHGMWQVYLERSSHGQFDGTFLEFVPHYFQGLYGLGGNFAWMGVHLWYLELLFVFTLVLMPVFAWASRIKARSSLRPADQRGLFSGVIYAFAVPVMLLALLSPETFLAAREWGGWSLAAHLVFFFSGFVLVSDGRLYESVRKLRWASFALAVVTTAGMSAVFAHSGDPEFGTTYYTWLIAVYGLSAWLWVLAFMGFAANRLRSGRPWLDHANEAVLPFYIIHQPLLLAVGSFVIALRIPDPEKWAGIFIAALLLFAGLYAPFIRRFRWLRFLFGMKTVGASGPWRSHPAGRIDLGSRKP